MLPRRTNDSDMFSGSIWISQTVLFDTRLYFAPENSVTRQNEVHTGLQASECLNSVYYVILFPLLKPPTQAITVRIFRDAILTAPCSGTFREIVYNTHISTVFEWIYRV